MAVLKANKTSMHKLIRDKADQIDLVFPIPTKKEVSFRETDSKSYVMAWNSRHQRFTFWLMACLGRPLLVAEIYEDGKQVGRDTVSLAIQELRDRGMVDDSR